MLLVCLLVGNEDLISDTILVKTMLVHLVCWLELIRYKSAL